MEYRVRRRSEAQRALPGCREEPFSDALVRRFLLRAGFRVSTACAVAHTRAHMHNLLKKLLSAMVTLMVQSHRMRFQLVDVVNACRILGIRLYGYDDVCVLERSGATAVYHVTEMVESNTTFGGPEQCDQEPDVEPGARYTRTDFVVNYAARAAECDDESNGDDDDVVSEWSWYGESDADSDSDSDSNSGSADDEGDNNECDDEDVEMDADNNNSSSSGRRKLKPWQQLQRTDKFVTSLITAQAMVDDQLLRTDDSDEDESADEDAPQGQGYDSDFGGSHAPVVSLIHAEAVTSEDRLWDTSNDIHTADEGAAERVLEAMQRGDDTEQYVMSRQVFGALLHSMMERYDVEISSVALSALHNASEQQLHRALTEGVLSHELRAMIREEQTAQQSELHTALHAALRAERKKVQERDQTLADLRAAFKAKELEMQQQIAHLQQQLSAQQQHSSDDVQMQTPTRTPAKRKSPGKRKATGNSKHSEVVRRQSGKSSSGAAQSLVGSLRSKIQDYASRNKKVRVNPI